MPSLKQWPTRGAVKLERSALRAQAIHAPSHQRWRGDRILFAEHHEGRRLISGDVRMPGVGHHDMSAVLRTSFDTMLRTCPLTVPSLS
jgi:hypothetical protein